MINISIECEDDSPFISIDNKYFCTINQKILFNAKVLKIEKIEIKDNQIIYNFHNKSSIVDIININNEKSIFIDRKWILKQEGEYKLISYFSYDDEGLFNDVMIPGIWYQGNVQGSGNFPSSLDCNIFSFCETRMAISGCVQMNNGKNNFICSISPSEKRDLISSVSYDRHGIRYVIPSYEWPKSYKGKNLLIDTINDTSLSFHVGKNGETINKRFFIRKDKQKDRYDSYKNYLNDIKPFYENNDKNYFSFDTYSIRKFTRLLNMIKKSDNNKAYIIMGEGNQELQSHYDYSAGSFLVKSLEAAYLLTREKDYISFETKEYLLARENLSKRFDLVNDDNLLIIISQLIADFFLDFEIKEGVHQDCYDINKKIFGGYLGIGEHHEFEMQINSRCNGETMLNYVLLYNSLKKLGVEKESYINLAKRVARFYCDKQLHSGSFGRWWTIDGKPMDIDGTNGVHIAVFFIELLKSLDENDFLYYDIKTAIYKAYEYYNTLCFDEQFYGDTLDADSFDKEAGVVFLKFFLDLYEIEREECYLESSKKVANFLLTWIWQDNIYFDKETPLGKRDFKTRGMTSVSVAHNHLDFYGIYISYDFFRLWEYTNIEIYRKQAKIMAKACCQLLSNPNDRLQRGEYYDGWQPEQINHTDWDYFNNPKRSNGGFYIDIAWVTVLGLGSYLKLKTKYKSEIE